MASDGKPAAQSAAEDDGEFLFTGIGLAAQQFFEQRTLRFLGHEADLLIDFFCGRGLGRDADAGRIAQDRVCEFNDVWREGRGEEQ